MNDISDFDRISTDATKALVMTALAIIGRKLENPDELSVKDVLAVVDSGNKRLGMNQLERADNLPVIHWTINNGAVTMQMSAPTKQAQEDVIEVEATQVSESAKDAFTMDLTSIETIGDVL